MIDRVETPDATPSLSLRQVRVRPVPAGVRAGWVLALLGVLSCGAGAAAESARGAGTGVVDAPADMRYLDRELRVLVRDTPIEVATRDETVRLTMPAQWLFRPDDVVLRSEAAVRLDALALALAAPPAQGTRIELTGHSDSLGRRELNEAFTLQRAEAVTALLVARGVAPARLVTRGAGEAKLLEKNEDSPAARQRNRRIELEIRPLRP